MLPSSPRRIFKRILILLIALVAVNLVHLAVQMYLENQEPAKGKEAKLPVIQPTMESETTIRLRAELAALEQTIDTDQAQMLDFLHGERTTDANSFGGSLLNSLSFNLVSTWKRIYEYAMKADIEHYRYKYADYVEIGEEFREFATWRVDFKKLAKIVKTNAIVYTLLHESPSALEIISRETSKDLERLKQDLNSITLKYSKTIFPWLFFQRTPSIRELQLEFINKTGGPFESGIVLTAGKKQFQNLLLTITSLRTVLNCTLPIEVHYAGYRDLPRPMVESLSSNFENLTTVNLMNHFNLEMLNHGGWSIKPFAMLASSFKNVIFLDADVLLFQDPAKAILKESMHFRKHGQVFFRDRSLNRQNGTFGTWFRKVNPIPTNYTAHHSRYYKHLSFHEQESGVVAMDKSRTGVLLSLILACRMNSKDTRIETYSHMWGDKETFWLSMEFLRVPFQFTPTYGGALGYKNGTNLVCGSNFHVDESLRPFWWNGGITMRKGAERDDWFMRFEHYAIDTEMYALKWLWEIDDAPFCLKPLFPRKEVFRLGDRERDMGLRYITLHQEILWSPTWQPVLDLVHEKKEDWL
ncbi:mannosyltransferase putative-domain-containing protein [Obelidium mucronatum]|nr:mannosyltransferase putative-domain-containing protein [Obelidium mucronatum]